MKRQNLAMLIIIITNFDYQKRLEAFYCVQVAYNGKMIIPPLTPQFRPLCGRKRVHDTIEKEGAELATGSACVT